ncbi:MAG TPA: HD domain-containing phosphohydrolase [Solirubrobacterales bacterium]|nr:HD domain-containing phosphohydrolase [Solirubrobacterales bacterium]
MAELSERARRTVLFGGLLALCLLAAFVAHVAVGFGGPGTNALFNIWIYNALILTSAAACLLRSALVPRERLAWALLGVGLLLYSGGEIYYAAVLAGQASVPIPSPADGGYLAFYPLAYAALVALLRARIGTFPVARWLDGAIVGSAVAALAAAFALGPIADASSEGQTLAVATNLAYPIADLTLLTMVATAASFTGWRPGRSWAVLGAGLLVLAVSDGVYLLQAAKGTYVEGTILDAGWLCGVLLVACAAWIKPGTMEPRGSRAVRIIAIPAAAALVAIGIQAAERFATAPSAAAVISLLTLVAVVVRLVLSLRESQGEARTKARESRTDELTGLPNRRALMLDLERAITRPAAAGSLRLLAMFDLDGFKLYNDTFGHPAGDALLERLGGRLERFAAAKGSAYRLGGDEFCLLAECTAAEVDAIVAGAGAALSERGEGFTVTASQGNVLLPSEAGSVKEALQLADRRMYANKVSERTSAGSQSRDVLLTALRERQPQLAEQAVDVAELALGVAEELGMEAEQRDETYRAAQLQGTGKMAIPDAILNKPGPLEDSEWEFVRQHTLIGERIIASAAALVPVARLVRSSGERWDGSGYPDSLRNEQIPLGARVIAVCEAYAAMISERPYSVAMLPSRALEELGRSAGSQFDPEVVAAFERVAAQRGLPKERRKTTNAPDVRQQAKRSRA